MERTKRHPANRETARGAERSTRQRGAIESVLRGTDRPLTPPEVHRAAHEMAPGLGLATVYRTLKLLIAEGTVLAINLPGESARFEMAQISHHHHFRCNRCRRVYDIPGCPGDMRRMAPRGFKVEGHDVILYGQCSGCRK
ncbi:MAG TPA: transcriptional repressor [Casimicrobiaceae bacterium]|nr:transcriptional repressor [Casimicrobiaceae bacterium]